MVRGGSNKTLLCGTSNSTQAKKAFTFSRLTFSQLVGVLDLHVLPDLEVDTFLSPLTLRQRALIPKNAVLGRSAGGRLRGFVLGARPAFVCRFKGRCGQEPVQVRPPFVRPLVRTKLRTMRSSQEGCSRLFFLFVWCFRPKNS